MKILGIIPARGGSKGVPGKNVKTLGTKPLIQYTLDAAKESSLLTQVIVSTDSEQIANCVIALGGEVPFLRPVSLALDTTPTLPVIQHAIEFYEKKRLIFDAVCILQPTHPFRMPGFIDKAISQFAKLNCDALVSVLPVPAEFNPHWVFEPQDNGFLKIATGDEVIIPRRQELPSAYYRDGSIYLARTNIVMQRNSLFGNSLGFIENDLRWHINIDTEEDWRKAEEMTKDFVARNWPSAI